MFTKYSMKYVEYKIILSVETNLIGTRYYTKIGVLKIKLYRTTLKTSKHSINPNPYINHLILSFIVI